ncbi:uncharacterized protein C8A04DRAFT_29169 [Dichotomopilus funicola]|uniref:F-box domain-containing protein n=1 Tax=Dichotomopilus funicola TaxID=1934379 RepID=A0AAN6ZLR8_9PEZI|nr:hypothetical protein C8A04DRAFT_29169 [Dichotomopilus funicola]
MFAQNAQPPSISRLESLPPEIRRHILLTLDLEEIFTIIQASAIFYQQYLLDRTTILRSSLRRTLGGAVIVARALHRFNHVRMLKKRGPETYEALDDFRHLLDASHSQPSTDTQLTDDEVLDMVVEYHSLIRPVVEKYVEWALDGLARDTGTVGEPRSPISQTERVRILRAFYRFQLYCRMFGSQDDAPSRAYRTWYLEGDIRISDLLNTLVPWEIEQLVSVNYFAALKYDRIFDSIESDLHPDHPRFADQVRPPTPDGAFELDNVVNRQSLLMGTSSRGIPLLHEIFFKVTDHESLVATMQKAICLPADLRLDADEFSCLDQAGWERYQDEDEKAQLIGTPLPFRGDSESHLGTQGNFPPLAWTLMWQGKYSLLFGECIPDWTRDAAYVMWDAERIESTGARDKLEKLAPELSLDIFDYT